MECHCAKCRAGKGDACPSIDELGAWKQVELRSKSAPTKMKLRGVDGLQCTTCKSTSHVNFSKVEDVSERQVGKVMILCDGCDRGYHLNCLPKTLEGGKRKTIPKIKTWFCDDCSLPCVTCDRGDVYDDPLKRLLQCCKCLSFQHMHCMQIPLSKEPTRSWTCRECQSLRPFTRRAAKQQGCGYCNGPASMDNAAQCMICNSMWHLHDPCLQQSQRPKTSKSRKTKRVKSKALGWKCPECTSGDCEAAGFV